VHEFLACLLNGGRGLVYVQKECRDTDSGIELFTSYASYVKTYLTSIMEPERTFATYRHLRGLPSLHPDTFLACKEGCTDGEISQLKLVLHNEDESSVLNHLVHVHYNAPKADLAPVYLRRRRYMYNQSSK
jgi:hypothetical protein